MRSPASSPKRRPRQLALHWAVPGLVAGVDEVGRGPLAGPVVAAAVILDDLKPVRHLRDSKELTARQRERLDAQIRERALCVCIGQASVEEIDRLNILQASLLAMQRAVAGLAVPPQLARVDGNRAPTLDCEIELIIGGDDSDTAIAAASILAKTARDAVMCALDARHPGYGFAQHKGYGTREHLAALGRLGPCSVHRTSFAPIAQRSLDFGAPAAAIAPDAVTAAMEAAADAAVADFATPDLPR
jgi:ribonuclease HII